MRGTHSLEEAQTAGQAWLAERLPQASGGSSRLTAEEVPVFLPEDPAQLEALLQQDADAQARRLTEQLHEDLWPAGSLVPISAVPMGPTSFHQAIRAANLRPAATAQPIVTDTAPEPSHGLRSDEAVVESVASLVTGRSIANWDDSYLRQFELGLLQIHRKIKETDELLRARTVRVSDEALGYSAHSSPPGDRPLKLLVPSAPLSPSAQALMDSLLKVVQAAVPLAADELRRVVLDLLREVEEDSHGA